MIPGSTRRALAALLTTALLAAQQASPPSQPPEPILRVSVTLVQVDAVVTDAKGKPVPDLTSDDFELLQDGRRQKITNFSYVGDAPPVETATRPATPAVTSARAPIAAPPRMLRPDQVRRTLALVVDDLGLSFESTAQVRQALKKFVDQDMQSGDLVAIVRTGAGMGALQQFTSDKRQLYAAIERIKFNFLGRAGVSAFAPITSDTVGEATTGAVNVRGTTPTSEMDESRTEYFSVGTLGAVNFIVRGLREMPGRKAVMLFSDGVRIFRGDGSTDRVIESLQRLTDLANRAGVVLYTIDPRGLPVLGLTAADNVSGQDPTSLTERLSQRRNDYFDSQDGMAYLAYETGGYFVHDNNDLNLGIREVLADQRGYYLLGYHPDESTFKNEKAKNTFHKITVRLKRPGLKVRYRHGFYGVPDTETKPVYRNPADQMFAAMSSPFATGGVHLRLTPLYSNSVKDGPHIQSLLHLEGRDLTFTDEPEEPGKPGGWKKTVFDILVVTFGDNGAEVNRTHMTYTLRVRGDTYENALKYGMTHAVNHPVKKPGAYQLRAAVRDTVSQKIGAASQFIEAPDLSKGRLALSGILIASEAPEGAAAPAPAAATPGAPPGAPEQKRTYDPQGHPAVRIFKQGSKVHYALQILNPQINKDTQKPDLETQLQVYREGKQIFAGKVAPFHPNVTPETKGAVAMGQVTLSQRMEPGEYALQVVVTDKLAKEKNRTVAQWIDFEVVKP